MSQTEEYPAISVEPKTGAERFHKDGQPLDTTLLDVWRWSASDLVRNATRGILAEYIVAQALGLARAVRAEWDAYDLVTESGLKVEVKSAAYLQSWFHRTLSAIGFGIRPTLAWSADTNELSSEQKRQADVYVFCLLAHRDKTTIDPLDLDQWTIYVLPSVVLDERCPAQKRIGLSGLLGLGPTETDSDGLASAVASVMVRAEAAGYPAAHPNETLDRLVPDLNHATHVSSLLAPAFSRVLPRAPEST
jgi:hypothetical protein